MKINAARKWLHRRSLRAAQAVAGAEAGYALALVSNAPERRGRTPPNKAAFKGRFDQLAEGMMDDAIAKGRCRNEPLFRFMDGEAGVLAGAIGFRCQFFL